MKTQVRNMVAVGLLVAGLGLTGCGSDEKTIKTPDGNVKVDKDGDKITIEGEDGSVTVGQDLPDGFPEDDVPVVDGDVVGGAKGADGGPYAWTAIVTTDGTPSEVMGDIKDDFEDAGYTGGESMSMGEAETATFENDEYEVGVTVVKADGKVTVTYAVREAGSE